MAEPRRRRSPLREKSILFFFFFFREVGRERESRRADSPFVRSFALSLVVCSLRLFVFAQKDSPVVRSCVSYEKTFARGWREKKSLSHPIPQKVQSLALIELDTADNSHRLSSRHYRQSERDRKFLNVRPKQAHTRTCQVSLTRGYWIYPSLSAGSFTAIFNHAFDLSLSSFLRSFSLPLSLLGHLLPVIQLQARHPPVPRDAGLGLDHLGLLQHTSDRRLPRK